MSSSSSKARNETTTTDQRTTNTLNAGLSGDIEDSFVAAGNYGDTSISSTVDSSTTENNVDMSRQFEDNSDNSFTLGFEDNSDSSTNYTDNSEYSSSWADSSNHSQNFTDNSEYSSAFEVAFSDSSNHSQNFTDNSEYSSAFELAFSDTSNNSQNYTDNSSYDGSGSINVGSGSYSYTSNITDGGAFALVGDAFASLSETTNKIIDAAGSLTQNSIDSAMAIKAGESLNERANSDLTAKLKTVGTVAMVGGVAYVAAKAMGKK